MPNSNWQAIQEHAIRQGLVLVQKTPRVCQVLRLSGTCSLWAGFDPERREGPTQRYTHMSAGLVFQGTWIQCQNYIRVNTEPVPPQHYQENS